MAELLTPVEWVAYMKKVTDKERFLERNGIWLGGLQVMEFLLEGRYDRTFFQNKKPEETYFKELQNEIQEVLSEGEIEKFEQAKENSYHPERGWEGYDDEEGDLDVDRYLSGEDNMFYNYRRCRRDKPSLTILFDCDIMFNERRGTEVTKRHDVIYKHVLECEADQRPVRVIAAFSLKINEVRKGFPVWVVIKDYTDPVFPAIWGCFRSNQSCNNYVNCIINMLVGTRTYGNGSSADIHVNNWLEGDEFFIPNGRRLKL